MQSIQSRLFIAFLKLRKKRPAWDFNTSITAFRQDCLKVVKAFGKLPKGITVTSLSIDGIYAEWLIPSNSESDKVLFYTIGGGYVSGCCEDHRAVVARIAKETGMRVLLFDHRLAPEHPFPAALEDSITAYRWLLKNNIQPSNIIIIGESAGGGLCLSTLLALRDQNIPLPAAAVAISPWTDLKLTGESYKTNAKVCFAPKGMHFVCCKYYIGENDPGLPLISPLYGDLYGLPPLLIQAGGNDTLRDDSIRFAKKAKEAGVDVSLTVADGMMHCYPLLPLFIPEAKQAMNELSAFVRFHLS